MPDLRWFVQCEVEVFSLSRIAWGFGECGDGCGFKMVFPKENKAVHICNLLNSDCSFSLSKLRVLPPTPYNYKSFIGS